MMRAFLLALIAIATIIAVAACGGSYASTTTTRPAPPQTLSSQMYGFRVALPGNWSGQDATGEWDGKELGPLDDPEWADATDAGFGRVLGVMSAPTGMGLAGWRAAVVRIAPDVCSESPSAVQTSLGGAPALEWTAACPHAQTGRTQVINLAALHGTHGYIMILASPAGSNAAESRRLFESVRQSFRFTR
jgi:hypothetical protein